MNLVAVTMAAALAGCTGTIGDVERLHASFDLPAGWTLIDDQPGYVTARLDQPTKDGNGPYVKLEVIPAEIFGGDDDVARTHVRRRFEASQNGVSSVPWPTSEFQELSLPSGITVYAYITPENYWFTHGDAQQVSWGSLFAYSRDGYVVNFYLSDRVDLYQDEMDLIAKTTKIGRK